MNRLLAFIWLLAVTPALALDLPEAARLTAEASRDGDGLALATAPWRDGDMGLEEVTGSVLHQAWRVSDTALTPQQLLEPIAAQIEDDGFDILLSCADRECGGFDFRYGLEMLPEPEMHVDLGDYRYLSARRDDGAAIAVMVSRGSGAGYIHISRVTPGRSPPSTAPTGSGDRAESALPQTATPAEGGLASAMSRDGHFVLADLEFSTGSSELSGTNFPSLVELAAWLKADPARQVVLVGHSDAVGALDANIDLSRRRAGAVVERLRDAHGVPEGQLRAEGVGYLSPIASNATPEGRTANRRVEAVAVQR